jgi:hypothetical protein
MLNQNSIEWVNEYPVDSLQIYFSASLELQEELINHGFQVPKSRDDKIKMPIPIIYANFQGWVKPREAITIERLIPPEWLNLDPKSLGWQETKVKNRKAYYLPPDEVFVRIGVIKNVNAVVLNLNVRSYHIERTSIRGINPEKWNNWVMIYINHQYIDDIAELLEKYLDKRYLDGIVCKVEYEEQQGGKEKTYFCRVSVRDFSFCLGCFDLAWRYLNIEAEEHCRWNPGLKLCTNIDAALGELKLRLRYDPSLQTYAKVGVAKIVGKRPQIMVKLSSEGPLKTINGIIKQQIQGKARGSLTYCDHKAKQQFLILDLPRFYIALKSTKEYLNKLPSD